MKSNINKNKKIIAIIGLMGVGKSTIGIKLAEKMGYYFVDADNEIEDHEKRAINEIFIKDGGILHSGGTEKLRPMACPG
jgi:shikimate kinase